MNLRVLHATLASLTAAGGAALLVSGMVATTRRSEPSVRLVLLVRRVALLGAALAGLTGGVLLVAGNRPHAGLHYLYALVAVAAVPLVSAVAARQPRRGGIYHAGAGLLVLLVCFRLAATG